MRLEIIQWREWGDDDDSLYSRLSLPGDRDLAEDICAEFELEDRSAEEDPDGPGAYLEISRLSFADGELLNTSDGRKFRLRFEEVHL